MSDLHGDASDDPLERKRALSRWENEGGAEPPSSGVTEAPMPDNGPAELGALHVRVIALENLVIALLATASDEQLTVAREMAAHISPRPGFTHHPLTLHATAHMLDLVERSSRFRSGEAF